MMRQVRRCFRVSSESARYSAQSLAHPKTIKIPVKWNHLTGK